MGQQARFVNDLIILDATGSSIMDDTNVIIHSTLDEGSDFFITDKWSGKLHFKISTFMVPSGMLSEAMEVIGDSTIRASRVFYVLSDFDSDTEMAELLLKAKIKKGINIKFLERVNGQYSIRGNTLAGTVVEDCFVIDGLRITPDDFFELVRSFEGWHFTLRFDDPTDC